MKLSARNLLRGTVKSVTPGSVNAEVVIELPGGVELVSVVTLESVKHLGLSKGRPAYAVIKASSVLLAVD
jgi:molybdopterin-binding protein